jgi:cytochrome c-type biogenesis protein CcmH/NrfG
MSAMKSNNDRIVDEMLDDDEVSSDGTTTKDKLPSEHSNHSSSKDTPIADNENRMVNYSKTLVLLVIAALAVAMGLATYTYVKSQETNAQRARVRKSSGPLSLLL